MAQLSRQPVIAKAKQPETAAAKQESGTAKQRETGQMAASAIPRFRFSCHEHVGDPNIRTPTSGHMLKNAASQPLTSLILQA